MLRHLVAIALLVAVPVLPALAKGNKPGKEQEHGSHSERDSDEWRDDDHGDHGWLRFSENERQWWRDHWRAEYTRGHCPPGLAKKHNGCLPPGQAKKRYAIGRPLPAEVVLVAVPQPLLYRLPRLEPGYRYGMVDGDLVKLAVGTSMVVDAIDGMLH
jgi:hypothetical protein